MGDCPQPGGYHYYGPLDAPSCVVCGEVRRTNHYVLVHGIGTPPPACLYILGPYPDRDAACDASELCEATLRARGERTYSTIEESPRVWNIPPHQSWSPPQG